MQAPTQRSLINRSQVDWERYAAVYDLLLEHNPAYQEIMQHFAQAFSQLPLSTGSYVVELGAGTGNHSLSAAHLKPDANIVHVDNDPGMNAAARRKARLRRLENLTVIEASADAFDFGHYQPLEAVTLMHALYTFPDPRRMLTRVYTALQPGGTLILCDLGRVLNLADWSLYLFQEIRRRHGVTAAARVFLAGQEVARQNKQIRLRQLDGTYWTHSPEELVQEVTNAGFQVLQVTLAYRGYSDFIVARRQ